MKKRSLVLVLLVVLAALGIATWTEPELMPWHSWWHPAEVVRPAEPPAVAASGAAPAAPEQPVEQVGESADSATPLQEILPRQSEGHRQGLQAAADPLHLHASAGLVLDAGTREVLYAKNPDAVLPMASITKLMTGLVVVESKVPLDEVITITEDDMDKERHSRSRLRVGSLLTRSEALHLALMSSENRAAHALGRTWPGGLEKFVEAMNGKARQLGLDHTSYIEPTGLSSANQSTARDLATLVTAASKYPLLREYSTDKEHLVAMGNRRLQYRNSNALVRGGGWDIELQKTGYIVEAGHCVAMETRLHDHDLVVVLLDSDSNGRRNADAAKLRSWWLAANGFSEERKVAAVKPEQRKPAVAKPEQRKPVMAKPEHKEAKAKHVAAKPAHQEHKGGRVHAQFAGS